MKNRIKIAIQKLDAIPEHVLLILNLCIAGFVVIAHGGALACALTNGSDQLVTIKILASFSLPLAVFIIITSTLALLTHCAKHVILGIHAVILSIGALAMLGWATSILFKGIPEVSRFSWSPGLMTFLCVYPVYLLRRTVFSRILSRSLVMYLHVVVLLVVVSVDVGIFAKLISRFSSFEDRSQKTSLKCIDHPIVGKWMMVNSSAGDLDGLTILVAKATGEFEVYCDNILNTRDPFQVEDDVFISEQDFYDFNRRPKIVIEGDAMKLIIESGASEKPSMIYEYSRML